MSYRIAGIDVHKKVLAVVVSDVEIESEFQFERRMFGSNPEQLRSLAAWLLSCVPAARDWTVLVPDAAFPTYGVLLLASRVSASTRKSSWNQRRNIGHRSHCPSTMSSDLVDPASRDPLRRTGPGSHQTIQVSAHVENDSATPKCRL